MEVVYNKVYDLSTHNGLVDWDKLKEDGVDFVMLRAGYGKIILMKGFTTMPQPA